MTDTPGPDIAAADRGGNFLAYYYVVALPLHAISGGIAAYGIWLLLVREGFRRAIGILFFLPLVWILAVSFPVVKITNILTIFRVVAVLVGFAVTGVLLIHRKNGGFDLHIGEK